MRYLEPDHPDAFLDYPEVQQPPEGKVLCAKCKGRGGWNLRINAYGPGKHFRCSCSNCNGWGYVDASQGDHVHEWQELDQDECRKRGITHYGMCYHVYLCLGCGITMAQDSSD